MAKLTKEQVENLQKRIAEKGKKARSKWAKAVHEDACWLLENAMEGYDEPYELNEKLVLNGAPNWKEFSWGGNAYCYNADIIKHYAPEGEAKNYWGLNKDGGYKRDTNSSGEHLLDIQARALRQAWWLIRDELNGKTDFSMALGEYEEDDDDDDEKELSADDYWGALVEYGIATDEELRLVTDINGYSIETLDDVLYARTGNRSWEQYCDENDIDFSIVDDAKGVVKATGKLAGNIVKNTTDKGGLLMF